MEKEIEKKITCIKEQLSFSKNYYIEHKLMPYGREEYINGLRTPVRLNPFELNPCLTESGITELEKKYNLTIPEEYKAFLLHIGNGGGAFFKPLEELIKIALRAEDKEFQFNKPFTIKELIATKVASGKLILYNYYPFEEWLIVKGPHKGKMYSFYTEGCYEAKDVNLMSRSFLDYFKESLQDKLEQLKSSSRKKQYDYSKDITKKIYYHPDDPEEKKKIIKEATEAIGKDIFTTEDYMHIVGDFTFLFSLNILAGETLLNKVEQGKITLTTFQLQTLLERLRFIYYLNNNEKGIPIIEKYIELSNNHLAYCDIAAIYLHLHKISQAWEYIQKAPPDKERTCFIKGKLYKVTNEREKAKQEFINSIQYFNTSYPHQIPSYKELAEIYLEEKDYQNAKTHYENAINKGPASFADQAFYGLLKVYTLQKDWVNAIKILHNIKRMGKDFLSIEQDPVFADLVASPEYKEFINKL